MSNNNVPVQNQPEDIPIDPSQVDPEQDRFNAFRASTQNALPEGLCDQWNRSENVFLRWAFQTWEMSPQDMRTGLINVISMCLQQIIHSRTPAAVQPEQPQQEHLLQQGQPQLGNLKSAKRRPYQKPNHLKQILDYDGAFRDDAADHWLREVDQYFWYERNLAGIEADEFEKVTVCKSKLIKGAGEWLINQEEKVVSSFEAPISTMD